MLLVALLFGANYVAAKLALREVGADDLVVIRLTATAAVLMAASRLQARDRPPAPLSRGDYARLLLYGVLGASLNQLAFLEGLTRSTATNASLMVVTVPLLTLAFAVALGRERATWNGVAGILTGLAGALVLILPRGGADFTSRTAIGNLLFLVSGASYALYLVLARPLLARLDATRVIGWVFVFGALTVLPMGIAGLPKMVGRGLSAQGAACLAYVVIAGTAIPYLLNGWALARVAASVVSAYALLQPLIATALARAILHEPFGRQTAVAAAMVVTGVALAAWRRP